MGVARLHLPAAPFNTADLPDVDHVQSFDTLYLAHIVHQPLKLQRYGHTSWQFSSITFGPSIAPPTGVGCAVTNPNTDSANSGNAYFPQTDSYRVTAVAASSGQESRGSDPASGVNDLFLKRNKNTISWAAVAGAERYRVYKSHNGGDYGYIGSTTGLSFVDDNIGADLSTGLPEAFNPFTGDRSYPSAVTFFEQRLWWGRTLDNPNALYGSRSADFENMDSSVPLAADASITIRLTSQGVNEANYLVPMDNLLVFGSDALIKIVGANEDYLSATPPPRQRRISSRGVYRLKPLTVDEVSFYLAATGSEVRSAGYSFDVDNVKTNDVSIFSPDLFEGYTIVDWCFASSPISCIWAVRSDGRLLCFTWEREHEVWGWTECPIAAGGKARSCCVIQEGGEDRVYVIVEVELAGVTRYFRCRMASARWQGLHLENHLDFSVQQEFAAPVNEIPNLWELEGSTVAVFGDGVEFEGLVVSGGKVTLPEGVEVSTAAVGIPFDVLIETLPLVSQLPDGASAGRKSQSGDVVLRLSRSRPPRVGTRQDKMYPLKPEFYRALTDDDSLVSGLIKGIGSPAIRNETTLFLQHRIGPFTLTAAYIDVDPGAK